MAGEKYVSTYMPHVCVHRPSSRRKRAEKHALTRAAHDETGSGAREQNFRHSTQSLPRHQMSRLANGGRVAGEVLQHWLSSGQPESFVGEQFGCPLVDGSCSSSMPLPFRCSREWICNPTGCSQYICMLHAPICRDSTRLAMPERLLELPSHHSDL
jgi:hypothetical protein